MPVAVRTLDWATEKVSPLILANKNSLSILNDSTKENENQEESQH